MNFDTFERPHENNMLLLGEIYYFNCGNHFLEYEQKVFFVTDAVLWGGETVNRLIYVITKIFMSSQLSVTV